MLNDSPDEVRERLRELLPRVGSKVALAEHFDPKGTSYSCVLNWGGPSRKRNTEGIRIIKRSESAIGVTQIERIASVSKSSHAAASVKPAATLERAATGAIGAAASVSADEPDQDHDQEDHEHSTSARVARLQHDRAARLAGDSEAEQAAAAASPFSGEAEGDAHHISRDPQPEDQTVIFIRLIMAWAPSGSRNELHEKFRGRWRSR